MGETEKGEVKSTYVGLFLIRITSPDPTLGTSESAVGLRSCSIGVIPAPVQQQQWYAVMLSAGLLVLCVLAALLSCAALAAVQTSLLKWCGGLLICCCPL